MACSGTQRGSPLPGLLLVTIYNLETQTPIHSLLQNSYSSLHIFIRIPIVTLPTSLHVGVSVTGRNPTLTGLSNIQERLEFETAEYKVYRQQAPNNQSFPTTWVECQHFKLLSDNIHQIKYHNVKSFIGLMIMLPTRVLLKCAWKV